jgi:hypothetical protein
MIIGSSNRRSSMKPKVFAVLVGLIIAVVGLVVGVRSASVSQSDGSSQSCGSAFTPAAVVGTDFGAAFGYKVDPKTTEQRCSDALGSKRTISLVAIGVGLLTMLGGAVVKTGSPAKV